MTPASLSEKANLNDAMKMSAALILTCLLSGSPDRYNVGYSREPAAGTSAARDIYSVGVSGPLGRRSEPPVDGASSRPK